MARVFSLKHSSTSVDNVCINNIGTEVCMRNDSLAKQNVSRVSCGKALPTNYCETQLSPSFLTLRIPVICRAHASFRGMLSREIPVKTLLSSIAWVFTHTLSITQPLQLNTIYKKLNKITIKFGMELKPTKHIVVNYNLIYEY